jgi:hypothetical protein
MYGKMLTLISCLVFKELKLKENHNNLVLLDTIKKKIM